MKSKPFIIIKVNKAGMTTEHLVHASKQVKEVLGIDVLFLSQEAEYLGFFDGEQMVKPQDVIYVDPTKQLPQWPVPPVNPIMPLPYPGIATPGDYWSWPYNVTTKTSVQNDNTVTSKE